MSAFVGVADVVADIINNQRQRGLSYKGRAEL